MINMELLIQYNVCFDCLKKWLRCQMEEKTADSIISVAVK